MSGPTLPDGLLTVAVPTRDRPHALAATLLGLAGQTRSGFEVIVSDQSDRAAAGDPVVAAAVRVAEHRGLAVRLVRHPPRGLAEHRQALLDRATGRYLLYLDDDVWLEPAAVAHAVDAITTLRCGFVGYAVQGLSYVDEVRPEEQRPYEEWPGRVEPERVRRGDPAWDRHRLHNAANLVHLARRHAPGPRGWRPYKVAWIGGCVLYDRAELVAAGGFDFWPDVPTPHAGEDVVAQLRVMERSGGAGLLPSRAFHLELPTTVTDRRHECYEHVFARDQPMARR